MISLFAYLVVIPLWVLAQLAKLFILMIIKLQPVAVWLMRKVSNGLYWLVKLTWSAANKIEQLQIKES